MKSVREIVIPRNKHSIDLENLSSSKILPNFKCNIYIYVCEKDNIINHFFKNQCYEILRQRSHDQKLWWTK